MQIDRIQAIVRPRNPWESIDLGFSMVRHWWKPLAKLWLACLIPITLIIYLLFYIYDKLGLATWIIWWLKPLFDRVILHYLSRALFDEQLSLGQTWKALPTLLMKTHLLSGLTIERIGLARSFRLPVWQLEGLAGYARNQRLKVLQQQTINTAQWLTLVCLHLEWLVYLSLFGIVYLMMPVTYNVDLGELIYNTHTTTPLWVEICRIIFNLIAVGLVETLYVAGGFALYLNRRTRLEGWDIELTFRRIAEKAK
jgi:hypothetical protein